MIFRVDFYLLRFLIVLLLSFISRVSFSQVGIGTTNPHSSSILEVASTSKGMLIPRMTKAQRLLISTPPQGLMIFQIDDLKGFWFYDGTVWQSIPDNSSKDIKIGFSVSTTWICPENVYSITVELWGGAGGGGGGGGGTSDRYGGNIRFGGRGGDGGYGGYNKSVMSVTPGTTYNVVVGSGGIGGTGGAPFYLCTSSAIAGLGTNGQNGSISSFSTLSANGGTGGVGGTGARCVGTPVYDFQNGSDGTSGTDGLIQNYTYAYTSFEQIRSYLPIAYLPVFPGSKSTKGSGGSGTYGNGSNGANGENGYVLITY